MDFSNAPDWFKEAILNRFINDSSFMNMSGYNFTHEGFVLPIGIKITIAVVYMVVCVVGLVGNCLVMYVIIRRNPAFWDNSGMGQRGTASLGDRRGQGHANPFRYTKMKTATNIYIFNLALADFLVLLTLPFQGTDVFLGSWPFGKLLCKIVIAIDYYNMFTSTFTLTMMSVDRYIAVCHPVKALDMRTPHKAKVVNICIWALASVIGIPAMVMGDVEEDPYGTAIECAVVLPQPCSFCDAVFGTCVFIFSFVVPVAIITICYTLMVKRLKNVRVLSGSKEKDRMLRRITRMVLIVVAVFVVCWTPIQIMVLVRALGLNLHNEFTVSLMHFCIALGYVNSSLNPVLYAFLDENFKRCFKEFCYPSSLRMELQRSTRMKSIAKDVGCNCKHADGTSNPA